jgi:phage terminase large subunit-like protein
MATEAVKRPPSACISAETAKTNLIRVKEVSAHRGKTMPAEPISLILREGQSVASPRPRSLETEMIAFSREWDRAVDGSPNRLDAAVWGLMNCRK